LNPDPPFKLVVDGIEIGGVTNVVVRLTRPLTPRQAEVLRALVAGVSRIDLARARGVSPAAITQMCHDIEAKGHVVPPPGGRHRPAEDRLAGLLAEGKTPREAAGIMGITTQRAYQLRRQANARIAAE
jgi:DNA-binding CsgD family transcriptional regulator